MHAGVTGPEVSGSVLSQAAEADLPFNPVRIHTTHFSKMLLLHLFCFTGNAVYTRRSCCEYLAQSVFVKK